MVRPTDTCQMGHAPASPARRRRWSEVAPDGARDETRGRRPVDQSRGQAHSARAVGTTVDKPVAMTDEPGHAEGLRSGNGPAVCGGPAPYDLARGRVDNPYGASLAVSVGGESGGHAGLPPFGAGRSRCVHLSSSMSLDPIVSHGPDACCSRPAWATSPRTARARRGREQRSCGVCRTAQDVEVVLAGRAIPLARACRQQSLVLIARRRPR